MMVVPCANKTAVHVHVYEYAYVDGAYTRDAGVALTVRWSAGNLQICTGAEMRRWIRTST
jgi:hypothetical protein